MKFIFAPDWFLGKDVLVEGFSFIVLAIFFALCIKYYKISRNKKILYLGFGFFLIAFAQLAAILTKLVLYYDTTFTQNIGHMIVTYRVVKSIDIFYKIGFFLNNLLTLLGLYTIYRLPSKKKSFIDLIISLYFLIISAIFSLNAYYLFHITALILIIAIIEIYYGIYTKNKSKNTKIMVIAFSMLALSQLVFIFSKNSILFVSANILEAVSYIILLILIIKLINPKYKVYKK